jgi:Domain of unknown function (DUF4352)
VRGLPVVHPIFAGVLGVVADLLRRHELLKMNPITRMMKRYIKMPLKYALPLLFIGALVLASTTGCTSNTSTSSATPTAVATAAATVQATATVKATATPTQSSGFVTLKVNSMTSSTQLGNYPLKATPSPGRTFAVFDVTVTNNNKNNLYMGNPLYFTLKTSDGTVYQYSSSSYFLGNEINGVSNTSPGDKVAGQIAFEIPQSAKPTQLLYGDLINGVVTVNL